VSEKLKSCPFCGKQPTQYLSNGTLGYTRTRWVIICNEQTCHSHPMVSAEGETGCHLDKRTNEEAQAVATERWNQRADESEVTSE
jgi:hypothetical protein